MTRSHILLLSAYRAASHGAWAERLERDHPDVRWTRLELPGRHFRWRIRGNPLSWIDALPDETPDRVLATSMVDLATLRGLNPGLARVPAVYYFHENQFAYPVSARQVASVEPQMVQLYGALAADRLAFNSAFNRDSFLDGVARLLARMPDRVPAGTRARLAARATIRPVPVDPVPPVEPRDPGLVLWNHRWEYDKDPDLFADAMIELAASGADFRLALLGPRPAAGCAALERLRTTLPGRIVADEHADPARYRDIVGRAGIVVSTARHEFQGLAVLEAAGAGARPLVPDALCYPEMYGPAHRYPAGDPSALAWRLARWLEGTPPPAVDVSAWSGPGTRAAWRELLGLAADGAAAPDARP